MGVRDYMRVTHVVEGITKRVVPLNLPKCDVQLWVEFVPLQHRESHWQPPFSPHGYFDPFLRRPSQPLVGWRSCLTPPLPLPTPLTEVVPGSFKFVRGTHTHLFFFKKNKNYYRSYNPKFFCRMIYN